MLERQAFLDKRSFLIHGHGYVFFFLDVPMVVKKRKSKRIPIRKKVKVEKKARERSRKKRKEIRKKERARTAPPSIFYTEEEKALLEQIKKNTKHRQLLHLSACTHKKEMSLEARIEESDVVLELVDSRDPQGSSSEDISRICISMNRPHHKIYYNTSHVPACVLEFWMARDNATVDTDASGIDRVLSSLGKPQLSVLVAANADFQEKCLAALGLCKGFKIERVVTDSRDGPQSVLRETQKITKQNYKSCVAALAGMFSKMELLLKYKVPDFGTVDELLESIGRENEFFKEKGRVDLVKSSEWLVDNIRKEHLFFTDIENNLQLVNRSVSCEPLL